MKYLVSILILSCLLCSCSEVENQSADCMCTAVFLSIGVVVIDQNNQPVDSLSVIVMNKTSRKVYDFYGSVIDYDGRYLVMTDQYVKDFSIYPRTIVFTGKKGNAEVSADYQIITDDCQCHVGKLSGPDTLKITL